MQEKTHTVTFELDAQRALAMAQFLKRLTWSEMRACALSDEECYDIKDAVYALQRALIEAGFNPR